MEAAREIQLSAGTLRYRDTGGSGPTLVFVHGLLANGMLWAKVVSLLEPQARCVVPDWPLGCHTTPMKPDADLSPRGVARMIAEFLERLELDDVTIVANDTGGAISQILVTERPERVARLVLTPSDCFEHFFPPAFRPLQWLARVPGGLNVALQPLRLRPLRRLPIAFGWIAKHGIPDEVTDAALRPYFSDRAIRRDTAKFVRGVDKRDTLAAAERLPGFDRPTLLAWASEDKFFPPKLAQRLLERLPRGRLELVDDSYTFVPLDQPERLAKLIRGFVLDESQAPAGARE
jgi:pimeloyl-ACP methyl ester carboxylesterase